MRPGAEPVVATGPRRVWKLTPVGEALRLIAEHFPPRSPPETRTATPKALHRILTQDIVADHDIPGFVRAAVDGYALGSQATHEAKHDHPVAFRIVGEVATGGEANPPKLDAREAVYITCGSQLPDEADAVVRLEEVKVADGYALLTRPVPHGENVDRRGQDVGEGEIALRRGRLLRSQDIAMLMALRRRTVRVARKPRVAVMPVGDELVDFTSPHGSGVVETNSFIFSRLLEAFYARPRRLRPVGDDAGRIAQSLREALRAADLVVTIGGCSVGAKDLVPEALALLKNAKLLFHGVALFPGKPFGLAQAGGKPVVLLPGRIISALAGYYLFVVPLLSRLVGVDLASWIPKVKATLTATVRAKGGTARFAVLKVKRDGASHLAEPLPKGVGLLNNFVEANGFTVLPEGGIAEAGSRVEVSLFSPAEWRCL